MLGWGKKAQDEPAYIERDSDRHSVSVRVMSRDLPGFRAITTDLSRTGVQLETSEMLQVGAGLRLALEFDKEELADFSAPAIVVWAKQDGVRRGRYRAGLNFTPTTDDEKRNLALMATVLQTRSEADLSVLLEEAKKLDPERAETYIRAETSKAESSSSSSATTRRMERPSGPTRVGYVPAHPGVYIPLSVYVEGYVWSRPHRFLCLTFVDGGELHSLYFPNCQMLTDYACSAELMVVGMFTTVTSAAIRQRQLFQQAEEPWKHYRFVAEGGVPVLDLISEPCQTYPPD